MSPPSTHAEAIVQALAAMPALERLSTSVRSWALSCAGAQRVEPPPPIDIPRADAQTQYGNVLDAIGSAGPSPLDRRLLGALLALSLRGHVPQEPGEQRRLAAQLVWLAMHGPMDALTALDAALGDDAAGVWSGAAELAQASNAEATLSERLVAAVALRGSRSPHAHVLANQLAERAQEPTLACALGLRDEVTPAVDRLSGELTWAPRGPLMTTALALSGVLLVRSAAGLLARVAFALRQPAEVRLSSRGLEISHRVELLGRVLRDKETVVPTDNLASVTREARYARGGLYAGLAALILGTYLGMGLLIDGVRAPGGSPSLLGMGLLLILAGIALDFVLSTYLDHAKKTVRLVVVPRRGRALCIRGLEAARTDALLRQLLTAMGGASSRPPAIGAQPSAASEGSS